MKTYLALYFSAEKEVFMLWKVFLAVNIVSFSVTDLELDYRKVFYIIVIPAFTIYSYKCIITLDNFIFFLAGMGLCTYVCSLFIQNLKKENILISRKDNFMTS